MIKVLFTVDYEIHGNGDGCPFRLMVEPTRRNLDTFDEYGAKLTIMADVAEILKFREYREETGQDRYHYQAIDQQLRDAIARGHDVQLHLHCSYFNATNKAGEWSQDWSEYNFAGLPEDRISEVLGIGKEYLESTLREVDPSYDCDVFRAANWAMQPSPAAVRALLRNGFRIDTSVFKYGKREGLVEFDYSEAFSEVLPWPAAEEDVCKVDKESSLLEYPIYCEERPLAAFLTPERVYRALVSRRHRMPGGVLTSPEGQGSPGPVRSGGPFGRVLDKFSRQHAWKADYNQCSGRQLVKALERAEEATADAPGPVPFVLIGHSKLFTRFNERRLRPFLEFVKSNPDRFSFGTFSDFETEGKARNPEAVLGNHN